MFNDYMWKTYLSAGGNQVARMFENNFQNEFTEDYITQILSFHCSYCPSKSITQQIEKQLSELKELLNNGEYLLDEGEYTLESAMDFFYGFLKGEENCSDQQAFDFFAGVIELYTTALSIELPDFFIPYYFRCNFNIFQKIAQEFDIDIPQIPNKKEYKERIYYYGELCGALYDFRENHHMTPYELYAFLYDFAPKYIGGIESYIIKELPEPKGAYFIGGTRNDGYLQNESDCITAWQCNPDTKAGDVIVMYLKSPISAVDSIWRSVSVGFNDPFFYYYRCTYIANPIGIPHITQKQLQTNDILGSLPIVKKNMQGINGVELLPSQYNHLVELTKADIPKLEYIVSYQNLSFLREKDVENKLIKPLLVKLDYSEHDYEQQLYMEIGNHNHALIPDFVMLPVKEKGRQSAFALIEAKLSIPTLAELKEVKIQARSYARLLNVKYAVIASKEKIWVMEPGEDFNFDNEIFTASWDEMKDVDTFTLLYKLIGKRK